MAELAEECSTLHIVGLPAGATRHEVYLLLCTLPGFEHADLMFDKGGKGRRPPVVFAKFDSAQSALLAKNTLSTLPFEWGSSTLMSVSFASKQSRAARKDKSVNSNEDIFPDQMARVHGKGYGPAGRIAGQRGDFGGFSGRSSTLYVQSVNNVDLTQATLITLTTNYPGVEKVTTHGTKAWVKFKTTEDAERALNLDGYESDVIGGARIKVVLARTDSY